MAELGNVPAQQETIKDELRHASALMEVRGKNVERSFKTNNARQQELARIQRKLFLRFTPRGRRTRASAIEAAANAAAQVQSNKDSLEKVRVVHSELEARRVELVRRRIQYDALDAELERLGPALFPPNTHPVLDALTWDIEVDRALAKMLPSEVDREQRARDALLIAEKLLKKTLSMLRDIIKVFMDAGVANNTKHHQRLFSGSTLAVAKRTAPMLLSAKPVLGEYFVRIAQARGRQRFVQRAPVLELVDLSRMPGQKAPMSEPELYGSVQASYTQCQASIAYVQREKLASSMREKGLRAKIRAIDGEITAARRRRQAAWALALEHIVRGPAAMDEALVDAFPMAAVPPPSVWDTPTNEPPPPDKVPSSAVSDITFSNTGEIISTSTSPPGMSDTLFRASLQRLRELLKDVDAHSRANDDDEDLPWNLLSLEGTRLEGSRTPARCRPTSPTMSLLQTLRASPCYLYIKCYLICTLVTLFAARPLSSRLNASGPWNWYDSTEGGHGATSWGRMQALLASATRRENRQSSEMEEPTMHWWWQERRFPYLFPPPQFPLNLPPPVRLTHIPLFERWRLRLHDMSQLRPWVAADDRDTNTYPELEWDASVRCSSELHPDEAAAIARRRRLMSSEGTNALARYLQLPDDEYVHPDDVPLVALGGSGGGYRAMYGYAGFLKEAENTGLWQCSTWVSGVSGSCWPIAAYYTIAQCSSDILIAHLLAMAHEEAHPMSLQAMDRIARSDRGIYFLLGPLLRKAQNRSLTVRIMDFYATLLLSYQFLPRPLSLFGTEHSYNGPRPHLEMQDDATPDKHRKYQPSEGLSRRSFQWSKTWERARINEGEQPIPILTGVRRVWRPQPSSHSESDKQPTIVGSGYDWYEISPLELGCRAIGAWIPTWAYSRTFENGKSQHRAPEVSLATIVGQCTGAPAGPLTAYIATMLASIPQGTVMSTLLSWINSFVMMKQWEKRWGNPIRAADEPNPFYGRGQDDIVVDMSGMDTETPGAPVVVPAGMGAPVAMPEEAPASESPGAHDVAAKPADLSMDPLSPTDTPYETPPQHPLHFPQVGLTTTPISQFFSQLPRLPELAYETTMRPRRGSDVSVDTTLFEHDPETFMAPMEDLARPEDDRDETQREPHQWRWEHTRRLRLMDSGLSNNLPNHVLAREERHADVIVSFDASSDVKSGAALERLHDFARECGIVMQTHPSTEHELRQGAEREKAAREAAEQVAGDTESTWAGEADRVHDEFDHKYAQRYDGWRSKFDSNRERPPDVRFVYCPLLPNAVQPGFDPTTAHYSTSYNLIWTADQVRALLRTAMANVEEGSRAARVIRSTVREAYETRRAARLAREAQLAALQAAGGSSAGGKRSSFAAARKGAAAGSAAPAATSAAPVHSAMYIPMDDACPDDTYPKDLPDSVLPHAAPPLAEAAPPMTAPPAATSASNRSLV